MLRRLLLGFAVLMAVVAFVFALLGHILLVVLALVIALLDLIFWMQET